MKTLVKDHHSKNQRIHSFILMLSACILLAGCIQTGTGGTAMPMSGAAAGSSGTDVNSSLERCDQALGTLAIDDGRKAGWYHSFSSATHITSVEPLIRLAVQQSNCFVITSIGNLRTSERMDRITDIQRNSGEYRAGSNQQKGQRVAADYYLEPSIVIDNASIGGIGGSVGGVIDGILGTGRVFSSLGGNMEMKSTVVTLSLFDIRSSVQISASEGDSTSTNFDSVMSLFGNDAHGNLSGYTKTPAGKATVAAFVDSYNEMVRSLRSYQAQEVSGGLGRGGVLKVN